MITSNNKAVTGVTVASATVFLIFTGIFVCMCGCLSWTAS